MAWDTEEEGYEEARRKADAQKLKQLMEQFWKDGPIASRTRKARWIYPEGLLVPKDTDLTN